MSTRPLLVAVEVIMHTTALLQKHATAADSTMRPALQFLSFICADMPAKKNMGQVSCSALHSLLDVIVLIVLFCGQLPGEHRLL